MTRGRFQILLWHRAATIMMILLQLAFILYVVLSNSRQSILFQGVLTVISVLAALHVLARRNKGAYKLSLIFLILLFPIFGGLLYWLFSVQMSTKGLQKKLDQIEKEGKYAFRLLEDSYEEAVREAPDHKADIRYLQKFNGFPVYKHTQTEYYSIGEDAFASILRELEQAQRYIFLEYFIVEEGVMWDAILEILKRKAAQGVDVRLIYDDLGCFLLLPREYPGILRSMGIKCHVFNPFRPLLTTVQNNRNHRKILSIDGKVAFTGGINLADEYINQKVRFGHWKDSAIMVKGYAAWSFTVMFLEMWSLLDDRKECYEDYLPYQAEGCWVPHDGLVQPYSDSPMDTENVSEHVCLHLIEKAQDYLYMTTPYLVLDDNMLSALVLTAKSGVDVRITTPRIPDKPLVQFLGRSYYRELIQGGVQIYEYEEGFIHSKNFVSDDKIATVGTVNLDFRSLYLHFECGVWLYQSSAVQQVKEDFLETLNSCRRITEEDCRANVVVRMLQDILRIFAPLI
jgi:cardiolipin synthase